jgi:hypothetical protein
MRIAHRLALYRSQSKTLCGVKGRLFQPAVIEHQHLGLLIFEKHLAIVGAVQRAIQMPADLRGIDARAVDKRSRRGGSHACVPG